MKVESSLTRLVQEVGVSRKQLVVLGTNVEAFNAETVLTSVPSVLPKPKPKLDPYPNPKEI